MKIRPRKYPVYLEFSSDIVMYCATGQCQDMLYLVNFLKILKCNYRACNVEIVVNMKVLWSISRILHVYTILANRTLHVYINLAKILQLLLSVTNKIHFPVLNNHLAEQNFTFSRCPFIHPPPHSHPSTLHIPLQQATLRHWVNRSLQCREPFFLLLISL